MKLAEWLKKKKVTKGEFAKRIGIARNTLYLYERGIRQPPLDIALRIERETGGEVRVEDLIKQPAEVK